MHNLGYDRLWEAPKILALVASCRGGGKAITDQKTQLHNINQMADNSTLLLSFFGVLSIV